LLQGKGLDCKGVCNAPASKTIFRMKMPSMADALAGKWPKDWEWAGNKNYEEMPIGRVFADAVLLPNGKVRGLIEVPAAPCGVSGSSGV
jgi:hypothetical protein